MTLLPSGLICPHIVNIIECVRRHQIHKVSRGSFGSVHPSLFLLFSLLKINISQTKNLKRYDRSPSIVDVSAISIVSKS